VWVYGADRKGFGKFLGSCNQPIVLLACRRWIPGRHDHESGLNPRPFEELFDGAGSGGVHVLRDLFVEEHVNVWVRDGTLVRASGGFFVLRCRTAKAKHCHRSPSV
jgi:hypothetical protein